MILDEPKWDAIVLEVQQLLDGDVAPIPMQADTSIRMVRGSVCLQPLF